MRLGRRQPIVPAITIRFWPGERYDLQPTGAVDYHRVMDVLHDIREKMEAQHRQEHDERGDWEDKHGKRPLLVVP